MQVLAVLLLLTGCATKNGIEKKIEVTRAALVTAGDPDSLAAASLLGGWSDGPRATQLALATQAAEGAPQRPDLAWLQLQFCGQVKSCDPAPGIAHMRSLDPENGVAWLGPLTQREQTKNPDQLRATLTAVADSKRFDVYWNTLVVHTVNAMLRTGKIDSPTALTAIMGMATAEVFPAYTDLTTACKGSALQSSNTVTECRRASVALRRGDTYLSELIGIAIAKRVWPEGSPEYQEAIEARWTARYRMTASLEISVRGPWDEEFAARYLGWMAAFNTEQAVALAEIEHAGVDPNPTENWKDPMPSPGSR
jgi:hypothetical protein